MSLKIDCARIIQRKMSGNMSREEYYLALLDLNVKYPMSGHNALSSYHFKNYKRINEVKEYGNIKYLTHIQPLNFKEAAEMYAQYERSIGPIQSWNDEREPGEEG